jgi:hypothetical protein
MSKTMTPEEAREWIRRNKGRLKEKLERGEDIPDLPDEDTPGGMTLGPRTELEFHRLIREIEKIAESEEGNDDAEREDT